MVKEKYISDLLLCHEPSRPLRSSGTRLLNVPKVKTSEAAFSCYITYVTYITHYICAYIMYNMHLSVANSQKT